MTFSRGAAALLAAGLLLAGCGVPPSGNAPSPTGTASPTGKLIPAVVTRNVDGDTVHVRVARHDEKVRMLLIDTPEDVAPDKPVEPFGREAAAFAAKTLPAGRKIYLEEGHRGHRRGKYGRLLAYIWTTRTAMYNEAVVRRGLARVAYVFPPNIDHLAALEADQAYAKDRHLGIWSIPGYATSHGFNLRIACRWARRRGLPIVEIVV